MMKQFLTWKKILILGVLLVTPLALAQCGESGGESVASHHVGPVGPTFPSGWYFDATVTPHSAPAGSTVIFTIRVWDRNGLPASGVEIWLGLSATETSVENPFFTNLYGYMTQQYEIEGGGGGEVTYLSVTVQDTVLTLPIQIIP